MSDSESDLDDETVHVAALRKLKNKDPDFFQFLKENDQNLLKFGASDDENGDEEPEINDPGNDELDTEIQINHKNLKKQIKELKCELQSTVTVQLCKKIISTFKYVVQKISNDETGKNLDSSLFNDIMRLCLVELAPALYKALRINVENENKIFDPSKSKTWSKMTSSIKSYLKDILKILPLMNESSSLTAVLKHIAQLIPYYLKFVKFARELIKKMINIWSTSEENIRVLSFLVIARLTRELPGEYQSQILKQMYFAYVKNTKFTSTSSWPLINFMKRSLVELYVINPELAYQHGFVYIRQLSIHLRNAITTKKKESYQTVYNWQYVHCLMFWAHLLSVFQNNDAIRTLLYPLIQTVIGTVNLIPTLKYAPLRFHLVRTLIQLSKEIQVFIPIAPLLLEVLQIADFNKKSTFSKKPFNPACALKASKAQVQEAGFKDCIVSEMCDLLHEYFKLYSNTVGFPELVLPSSIQIKAFLKKCKVPKYNQQIKSLLDALNENSKFIEEKRKAFSPKISDDIEIKQWEERILNEGPPLLKRHKRNVIKENIETPTKKIKLS